MVLDTLRSFAYTGLPEKLTESIYAADEVQAAGVIHLFHSILVIIKTNSNKEKAQCIYLLLGLRVLALLKIR